MSVPKITAVGSIGLDTVTTPAGSREEMLGGSVIHFAVSASFQTRVGIVGVVGDDFPAKEIAFLERRGIDVRGIETIRGGRTFRWAGSYMNDLNAADTHSTELNVFARFEPKLPAEYARAPFLFLANIHPQLQLHVIGEMGGKAYRICDTMNLWIRETRDALCAVFKKVDMVIMNDGEARMFTGEGNLIRAGKAMLSFGLDYCVVKKGEHGAMVFGRKGFFAAVPAYPVERVVDPTGAGDSFAGGFAGCLARLGRTDHAAVRQALRWGSIMGSFNVADFSCDRFRRLKDAQLRARAKEFDAVCGVR